MSDEQPRTSRLELAVTEGDFVDRQSAKRALFSPACWPSSETLRARCLEVSSPPETEPGRAIFVTATGPRSALWQLEPKAPSGRITVGFGRAAEAAIVVAREVVSRDVAVLARPGCIQHPSPWSARLLARNGEGVDRVVEGSSLGLAVALALVSDLGAVPMPGDVLAAATVDARGRLGAVDGLETKLEVVCEWAPGVKRLLVAAVQHEEAVGLIAKLGLDIAVPKDLTTIGDAVSTTFPTLFDDLADRWTRDPATAAEVAAWLFRLAVDNTPELQGWRGFARTADTIASALGEGSSAIEARIAAAIASRHAGEPRSVELPKAWLAEQPRPRRVRLIAHALQAASDSGDAAWEVAAEAARAELAPSRDRVDVDHILEGALGRAHAAWHEWEIAEEMLALAVKGWLDIDRVDECSFALCEQLRVCGIRGNAARVDILVEQVAKLVNDPRVDHGSRMYLQLAALRAMVQTGRSREAIEYDARTGVNWDRAPDHVQASRLRWLMSALRASGQADEADELGERLQAMAQEKPQDTGFVHCLVLLDQALERDDAAAADEAIAELEELERASVHRIRARAGEEMFQHAIARCWRY